MCTLPDLESRLSILEKEVGEFRDRFCSFGPVDPEGLEKILENVEYWKRCNRIKRWCKRFFTNDTEA